jgi:hypothetical protein
MQSRRMKRQTTPSTSFIRLTTKGEVVEWTAITGWSGAAAHALGAAQSPAASHYAYSSNSSVQCSQVSCSCSVLSCRIKTFSHCFAKTFKWTNMIPFHLHIRLLLSSPHFPTPYSGARSGSKFINPNFLSFHSSPIQKVTKEQNSRLRSHVMIPKSLQTDKEDQKSRRKKTDRISAIGAPFTPLYAISGIAHRNKDKCKGKIVDDVQRVCVSGGLFGGKRVWVEVCDVGGTRWTKN